MNRIYKLKFDKRRNELVVVSEITTGVGNAKATGSVEDEKSPRRGVRAMALSLLAGMMIMAHPAMSANLRPVARLWQVQAVSRRLPATR